MSRFDSAKYAGQTFGRLVAGKSLRRGRVTYVECLCSCGKKLEARAGNLKSGATSSCGCFRSESLVNNSRRRRSHPTLNLMLNYYKRNAKVRGIAWDLSIEQFSDITKRNCRYCGAPPSSMRCLKGRCVANGLDRIDSSGPYATWNVVACCATCNKAKLQMSFIEFRDWVRRVHHRLESDV